MNPGKKIVLEIWGDLYAGELWAEIKRREISQEVVETIEVRQMNRDFRFSAEHCKAQYRSYGSFIIVKKNFSEDYPREIIIFVEHVSAKYSIDVEVHLSRVLIFGTKP